MTTKKIKRKMIEHIVYFEAGSRRDKKGRLKVYYLDPRDGGGTYEVAGINDKYHGPAVRTLVKMIESDRYLEAEEYVIDYIGKYTDVVSKYSKDDGIEFFLRDCCWNRGPKGSRIILQLALGVAPDGNIGPQSRAALRKSEMKPHKLIRSMRKARETYERRKRDESSPFWRGLVNRWNAAMRIALALSPIRYIGS